MSLTIVPATTTVGDGWKLLLKMKGKELQPVAYNARIMFQNHPDYKGFIRWNKITLKIEITGGALVENANIDDTDDVITWAQDHLISKHDLNLGREEVGRRLYAVAQENKYDPLQDYLLSLKWDGLSRLDDWLITYGNARKMADNYVNIVGRKWLLSCVARAFQPGCKADVVLVVEGEQGAHKSTMLRILGGLWYTEASGVLGDKDSKQLIGAAWICELPDMASFSKSDRNAMKAFFSSNVDRYRPPYGKTTLEVPRRAVFAATTNDEGYLGDPTGHRRFWPVLLNDIDRAALIRDRDQLWAEAVAVYRSSSACVACANSSIVVPGEEGRCDNHAWWLTAHEREIARVQTKIREEEDSWGSPVLKFAIDPRASLKSGSPTNETVELTTANILIHALDFELKYVSRSDEMRISSIMKKAGFTRARRGINGVWTILPPK